MDIKISGTSSTFSERADFGVSMWQTNEGKFVEKDFYTPQEKGEYAEIFGTGLQVIGFTPLIDMRYFSDLYVTNVRLLGLVLLKSLRFGTAIEDSVADFNGPNVVFQLSDEFGQKATPMYKRLIDLCLTDDVTSTIVEIFVRSICAFSYIPNEKAFQSKSATIKVGPVVVKAECPR